jgi:hypothetical protein
MPRLLFRVFPLAVGFTVTSCILPEPPRVEPVPPGQGIEEKSPRQRAPAERGVMSKRVIDKQPPNILVAGDGTSCTVTAERYRKVQIGKHEICLWR